MQSMPYKAGVAFNLRMGIMSAGCLGMMKSIKGVMRGSEKDFRLFLMAGVFLGIAQSVDGSTLTNYLKEHIGMMIMRRSTPFIWPVPAT